MLHPQHLEGSPGPPEVIERWDQLLGPGVSPAGAVRCALGTLKTNVTGKLSNLLISSKALGFLHPRFGFADRLDWVFLRFKRLVKITTSSTQNVTRIVIFQNQK